MIIVSSHVADSRCQSCTQQAEADSICLHVRETEDALITDVRGGSYLLPFPSYLRTSAGPLAAAKRLVL